MTSLWSIRVLIVDDNPQMRFLVRQLMGALGFNHCWDCGDVNTAMRMMKTHGADLIITDLAMQPDDGITLTHRVRDEEHSPNPYAAVIMMTGYADRQRVSAARDAGANSFLAKPISARSLVQHVNAVVNDERPFVRAVDYFGPDRRRDPGRNYDGPRRRADDDGRPREVEWDVRDTVQV